MTAVDWRLAEWWDMPGPGRFLDRVADRALGDMTGVTGLVLPDPRPPGLLDAVAKRIERNSGALVTRVNARSGLRGRSPTTLMAASIGIVARVRTVGDFTTSAELSGRVFLVEAIPRDDWDAWAIFLTLLKAERSRSSGQLAPSVLVALPTAVPPEEYRSVFGDPLRWQGVVSRIDTELFTERENAWPDDSLVARTAVSVTVELAGWDPLMVQTLARLPIEDQIDPRGALLSAADIVGDRVPSWSNGLVDRWDGVAYPHTLCLRERDGRRLASRLWRAHVRTVFPFLDQVRLAFASRYAQRLYAGLPLVKHFHARQVTYHHPHELELHDLTEALKLDLPIREVTLLQDCKFLRRQMAHSEPGDAIRIRRASEIWEDIVDAFPLETHAWDWPRCGQRLVVLVGPSGAGKSHWAERNHDPGDVVSSDAIRNKFYGRIDMAGDQEPIFAQLRREVVLRLSAGRSVVIDATNIKKEDRIVNARLMPSDLSVEYVVIDRLMTDKESTAGWRKDRPGLLSDHAELFSTGLEDILAGDNLPNVSVIDLRPPLAPEIKYVGDS